MHDKIFGVKKFAARPWWLGAAFVSGFMIGSELSYYDRMQADISVIHRNAS